MTNVLEHIDSYFQGELNPDEKRKFEQAILNDPEFAKEVAFYVSSVSMLKEGARKAVLDLVPGLSTEDLAARKSRFRNLYEKQKQDGLNKDGFNDDGSNNEDLTTPGNVRPMSFLGDRNPARTGTDGFVANKYDESADETFENSSYTGSLQESFRGTRTPVISLLSKWKIPAAAAIAMVVLMSIYFLNSGSSHTQMADTFIKTELADVGVSMGTVADSMMIAKNRYNASDFPGALNMFEKIMVSNPSEVKAIELAGISALQLKNYPKAYQYFTKLSQIDGLISNPGKFYAAVTLMKQNKPGDQEKAKQLLEQVAANNLGHSTEATEWLENW